MHESLGTPALAFTTLGFEWTSEAVTAAATVVLVVITAVYAWDANRLRVAARDDRELGQFPVISFFPQHHINKEGGIAAFGTFNSVTVRNTGNAPALYVRIAVEMLDDPDRYLTIAPISKTIGTIGAGTEHIFDLPESSLKVPESGNVSPTHVRIQASACYRNVYGREFESVTVFELRSSDDWVMVDESINL